MKLKDLMDKINRTWYLPTLQRDYVWLEKKKEKKVEKLFDSLMLGYPIGQIVIWKNFKDIDSMKIYKFLDHYEKGGKNETGSQPIDNSKIEALVLDGQQRLTSLYIATQQNGYIQDGLIKKFLHLNLLYNSDMVDKDSADEVSYQFEFISEEEAKRVDSENLWFKVSSLVDNTYDDFVKYKDSIMNLLLSKLPNDMISTREKEREIENTIWKKLDLLWRNVREKEINCEEVKNSQTDSLLEIFVRLNDGGVKLEKADLLLSFMEANSNLFKPNGARETISNFVKETINNRISALTDNRVMTKKDFVLKASLMLSDLQIRYSIKNFTKNNLSKIDSKWQDITTTLETVYALLDKYHFSTSTLTSDNALLPIAYYLLMNGLNKQSFIDSKDLNDIKNRCMLIDWLSKALISGVFGGSSDAILIKYRDAIKTTKKLEVIGAKKLTRKDIENMVTKAKFHEQYTQLILFLVTDSKYWENSQDHIFPQKEFQKGNLKQSKEFMNNIANLQLLSKSENSHKNDMSAEEWATRISDDEKHLNLYPDGIELKNEYFIKFIERRKKMIVDKLCEKLRISE